MPFLQRPLFPASSFGNPRRCVQMTSMPELVAMLHSFVGLAAVLVGFATYLGPHKAMSSGEHTLHLVEIFLGVIIGSVTFTGSVIAFLKLRGTIGGKPFMLPGRSCDQSDHAYRHYRAWSRLSNVS